MYVENINHKFYNTLTTHIYQKRVCFSIVNNVIISLCYEYKDIINVFVGIWDKLKGWLTIPDFVFPFSHLKNFRGYLE
jgi:hypothetical protein